MVPEFRKRGFSWNGPYGTLEEALEVVATHARPGSVVLLSPGAASFELFKNEFDRGNTFKALVRSRFSDGGTKP
jgi:UDP-N-acetylmuramoylalanine--D-glutamate ligase